MKKGNGMKATKGAARSSNRPRRFQALPAVGARVVYFYAGRWHAGVVLRIDEATGMAMLAMDDGERAYRALSRLRKAP